MIARAALRASVGALVALIVGAGTSLAEAPSASLRPEPRMSTSAVAEGEAVPVTASAGTTAAIAPARTPKPRPGSTALEVIAADGGAISGRQPRPRPAAAQRPARVVQVAAISALTHSIRPEARPENPRRRSVVKAAGFRSQPVPEATTGRKGSVCGDRAIKGTTIPPIAAKLKGCGLQDGVKVTSVDGVMLSTPAIMDCPTATALKTWVAKGVKPAVGKLGGGVDRLQVAAHYSCRPRNNQKGARVSEHGRGRAIDISAIVLKNGVSISVLKGWADRQHGRILKAAHKAACGPFGTVLGPGANAFHKDHFHFDTARYRSGSYCR